MEDIDQVQGMIPSVLAGERFGVDVRRHVVGVLIEDGCGIFERVLAQVFVHPLDGNSMHSAQMPHGGVSSN